MILSLLTFKQIACGYTTSIEKSKNTIVNYSIDPSMTMTVSKVNEKWFTFLKAHDIIKILNALNVNEVIKGMKFKVFI